MEQSKIRPPQIFLRFFRWFCHPELKKYVEGDLLELFYERLEKHGRRNASFWFALDVILLFRPSIIRPYQPTNPMIMYRSYFKIGWRTMVRNKLYSVIKILGLGIGLTVCMLILLYTKDEVSFDRFHEKKDQIFRIVQDWTYNMSGKDENQKMGITNAVIGEVFEKEIPEVDQMVRVNGMGVIVKKDNDVFTEHALAVDSNYFKVFSFHLIAGNPTTALNDLHSIILSKEIANRYFGTTDVLGKTMQIKVADEFMDFKVTGLTEGSPQNSTLTDDMLVPFQVYERYVNNNKGWIGGSMNTFLMLHEGADQAAVTRKMQSIFDAHTKDQIAQHEQEDNMKLSIIMGLQPLTDIHLNTTLGPDNGMADGSNPVYSYVLTCIAVFILIIACINFVNLAIAQSIKRSREIGVRKVVGSTRSQVIRQFLTESFLVSTVSFALAILLTGLLIPFFNQLANKQLSFSYLADGYLVAGYLALLVITSLLAGVYPSLVLSSFQPVKVLYGRSVGIRKSLLTRGLIVLQFTLAIFLIIGTLVVNSQLNFLSHTDLGYDSQDQVQVEIPIRNASERLPDQFKQELLGKAGIVGVAARNRGRNISGVKVDEKTIEIENVKIDDQYIPSFQIKLVEGRNFSAGRPADSLHSVIVNERFVKEAGWSLEDAVGKTVQFMDDEKREATVVGVIKDYHYVSLKEEIKPELLSMNPNFNFGELWVKIDPARTPEALAEIRKAFDKLVPLFPYNYAFMNDINAKNYQTEAKWRLIISIASGLFIFISCMGLFGLVGLSVEYRTKEIGIRKVLGAAVSRIVGMISREFMVLTTVSFALAVPLAWLAVGKWLEGFAYRISPGWWMFALGGVVVMLVAFLVVGAQAFRAAKADPVKNLRSE